MRGVLRRGLLGRNHGEVSEGGDFFRGKKRPLFKYLNPKLPIYPVEVNWGGEGKLETA